MQGVKSHHPPGGVCVITGELTRYSHSMRALMALKVPPNSAMPWMAGVLVAYNINVAFQAVMDNPALQWAWIMGDDHTFPPDVLIKLLDRELDAVVPLCLNRAPPMDPTIVEGSRLKYLEDLPTSGLYKLRDGETCGDAGLLIRRNVLEKTGPDWYDRKKSGSHNAEDREFIEKIKGAGFDIYVDMDNPIGHLATVEFMPVKSGERWEVRINCGGRHVCDLGAMRR